MITALTVIRIISTIFAVVSCTLQIYNFFKDNEFETMKYIVVTSLWLILSNVIGIVTNIMSRN